MSLESYKGWLKDEIAKNQNMVKTFLANDPKEYEAFGGCDHVIRAAAFLPVFEDVLNLLETTDHPPERIYDYAIRAAVRTIDAGHSSSVTGTLYRRYANKAWAQIVERMWMDGVVKAPQ